MEQAQREYFYKIDQEGKLFHDGAEITDEKLLRLFMRDIHEDKNGTLVVMCQGERNVIEVEDVPFVVLGIDLNENRIELNFAGGYQESLDPQSLWVGAENVMYCLVRAGEFKARFNRNSYLELTKLIKMDVASGSYFLVLGDEKYKINKK
ncbi:hypothetical protein BVY03_02420 [bacterium K02(2017)]|nr:hypothetical protein BVY03_02420 [bacterium K02(2017)]